MGKLNLYFYRRRNGKNNFGDDLSPLLISHFLRCDVQKSSMMNADLIGIGSVLSYWKSHWRASKRKILDKVFFRPAPAIWGSGLIAPRQLVEPNFDILALRGPLTKSCLSRDREIPFGDPGILASMLVERSPKSGSIGIVPHYVDKLSPIIRKLATIDGFKIIDVEGDCIEVLKSISECNYILSSSLHGLITADSYGIPNARIKLSNNIGGGDFKFIDYYLGMGRTPVSTDLITSLDDVFHAIEVLKMQDVEISPGKLVDTKGILVERLITWAKQHQQ